MCEASPSREPNLGQGPQGQREIEIERERGWDILKKAWITSNKKGDEPMETNVKKGKDKRGKSKDLSQGKMVGWR